MPIIISSLLFLGSLPPFNIPGIGLFFLIPLLIKRHGTRSALVIQDGFLFSSIISAYIFFGTWSYNFYAYLAIVLIFSVVFTVFLYISALIITSKKLLAVLLIPFVWVFIELVFEFFNIPITLSILFTPITLLLIPAQYGGQYLLSTLLIGIQVYIVVIYNQVNSRQYFDRPTYLLSFILPIIMLVAFFLPEIKHRENDSLNISIVQTNAHPRNTYAIASDNMLELLHQHRQDLLASVFSTSVRPELIVWPEVSVSKYEFRNVSNFSRMAASSAVNMLIASPDISPSGKSYNAVFSLSSSGTVLHRYTKNIMIPFLEDTSREEVSWLPHNRLPGKPGSIICYESVFSRPAVKLAAGGAGFITLSTNDAYAGPSILPYLHLQFSRLRAVETGKTILRAANGGPSAVITADGKISSTLDLYTSGVIHTSVIPVYKLTFYVRHYDKILMGYWIISIMAISIIIFIRTRLTPCQLLSQRLLVKDIFMSVIFLFISLGFQYFLILSEYQMNSGSHVPPSFVNFQQGHIANNFSYEKLMGSTPHDSLLSSITYLLRDYGNNITLTAIRNKSASVHGDVNDINIEKIIDSFNYSTVSKDFTGTHPFNSRLITTPCLALLTSGETVVISDFTEKETVFFSPYYGEILAVRTDAFIKNWTGKTINLHVKEKPWDT